MQAQSKEYRRKTHRSIQEELFVGVGFGQLRIAQRTAFNLPGNHVVPKVFHAHKLLRSAVLFDTDTLYIPS